jgi:superfamily II DNA/RNA helicase
VFNFDVPIHAEDYVHRIGRTGRAGREGHAFMLVTPDDAKHFKAILGLIKRDIPFFTVNAESSSTPAEAIIGEERREGRRPRHKAAEKTVRTAEDNNNKPAVSKQPPATASKVNSRQASRPPRPTVGAVENSPGFNPENMPAFLAKPMRVS